MHACLWGCMCALSHMGTCVLLQYDTRKLLGAWLQKVVGGAKGLAVRIRVEILSQTPLLDLGFYCVVKACRVGPRKRPGKEPHKEPHNIGGCKRKWKKGTVAPKGERGHTSATREVVREKVRVARVLIKSYPLTPELSAKLFAQQRNKRLEVLGSPHHWMVAEWVGGSAENLGVSVQKSLACYHGPLHTHHILLQLQRVAMSALSSLLLTQALLQHVDCDQCMRQEILQKNMQAKLSRTLTLQLFYWLDWRNGAVWMEHSKQRLLVSIDTVVAQSKIVCHSPKVSITWAGKMDQKLPSMLVPGKMSWATATRSNRKCKTRLEKIGGSRVDTEPTAWGLDAQVWNLLPVWAGEKAFKKGMPILQKAGFESVEDSLMTAVGFSSKAY